MALHEFYLEQKGPTRVDLDEPVVERLRKACRPEMTDQDVEDFFNSEEIYSKQDRCYYIIAAEGDPDTFLNWNGNWDSLYDCLVAVFKCGHWQMDIQQLEAEAKKYEKNPG